MRKSSSYQNYVKSAVDKTGFSPKLKENYKDYFFKSTEKRFRNSYAIDLVEGEVKKGKLAKKKIKILDIGSGTGTIPLCFEKLGYEKITGLDTERNFIEVAKKRCKKYKFVLGSSEKLPFKDVSFDFITIVDVMEFVDASRTIKEASRVLKKGGFVYFENFNRVVHKKMNRIPIIGYFIQTAEWYKTNTHKKITTICRKNGLEIIKSSSVFDVSFRMLSFRQKLYYNLIRLFFLETLLSPTMYYWARKIR